MTKSFFKNFKSNWRGYLGAGILLIIILAVIFAPLFAPYDPMKQSLPDALRAPSFLPTETGGMHLLGTDQLGRDIFTRVLYGGRVSLTVGLAAIAISSVIGVSFGLVSGFFGRWIDSIIMRLVDIQLAIPSILLAIFMAAVMKSGLVNIIIVLAITGWVQYARVVRGSVLKIKEMEYIDAAVSIGCTSTRILFVHILPNVMNSVIVIGTLQMARMILLEASLSFLGLGVNVATPTWGNMISNGRSYITSAWWMCFVPGIAIVAVIVAINLLGDWLREVLDPHFK